MKFTIAVVAAFAGAAFAELPACADSCLPSAAKSAGCKGADDAECLCKPDVQQVIGADNDFLQCLTDASCSSEDLAAISNMSVGECKVPTSDDSASSTTSSSDSAQTSEKDDEGSAATNAIFGAAAFIAAVLAI